MSRQAGLGAAVSASMRAAAGLGAQRADATTEPYRLDLGSGRPQLPDRRWRAGNRGSRWDGAGLHRCPHPRRTGREALTRPGHVRSAPKADRDRANRGGLPRSFARPVRRPRPGNPRRSAADDDLSAEPLEGCGNATAFFEDVYHDDRQRPSSILVAYSDNGTDPATRPNRDAREPLR